jgi:molybdate transport system substrate-binding protein
MGGVVKAGAPKPDISTMAGLKQALLNAKDAAGLAWNQAPKF